MDTIEDLMEDLMKIDITSTSFWTLMLFMGTSQDMEVDPMNVVENMEEEITTDHHTISMMLFTISLLVAGAILQFTLIIALIKATEEAIMEEPYPSHPIPKVLGQPAHLLTGNPLNNPHLGNQDNKFGNKVHRLKPGPVNPKSKPKQHQLGTFQLNYQPRLGPHQLRLNNQPRLGPGQLLYNKHGKAQFNRYLNNKLLLKHHNLNNKEKIGIF
jgi:hypothetical protein